MKVAAVAYLKKTERYDEILRVAMKIVIQEGIASITARRIAKEADIAVGQIHHHFKSIGQLKAQALIKVSDELVAQAEYSRCDENLIDKIIYLVSPIDGEKGLAIRKLWNEATFLAERDPDIKQASQQSTQEWHKALVRLLDEAIATKVIPKKDASALAWRLIAFSCGVDSLAIIDEHLFSKEAVHQHIMTLLR